MSWILLVLYTSLAGAMLRHADNGTGPEPQDPDDPPGLESPGPDDDDTDPPETEVARRPL